MKRSYVSVGVGTASLLLVLAVLSLSLLAALTALSVHNDAVLTERSIAVAKSDIEMYAAAETVRAALSDAANAPHPDGETAEELLARIAGALPPDAGTEGNIVSFMRQSGARTLYVALSAVNEGGLWRLRYAERRLTAETEETEWN